MKELNHLSALLAGAIGATILVSPGICAGQEAGLIARWTFDDPANLGKDSAGTYDGTVVGGAGSFASSRVGAGALLAEGGGYIKVPDASSLRFAGTNSYSVSVWFYPEANPTWGGIIDKSRDQGAWWGIWRNPDLPRVFTGSAETWPPTEPFLTDNEWHHAVVVQDGNAGTYRVFVDGADLQVPFNTPLPDTDSGDLLIGAANTGSGFENFRGLIDDARVYNRALTDSEVTQLYNATVPERTLPLAILQQPQDAQVFAGDQASFTARVNALDFSYQWYKGAAPVGDPGSAVMGLAILNTGPLSAGDDGLAYKVVFTGPSGGSITSRVASVAINTATGIDAGLVGHWTFDDAANLGKDIASTNDAVVVGGAYSFGSGRVGTGALALNGVDGHLEVADTAALRFAAGQNFVLSAWVYPSIAPNAWSGVVTKSRSQAPWYGIWIDNMNQWAFGGPNGVIGPVLTLDGNGAVAPQWHHVAIMQDGMAGTASIFVDGVLASSGTAVDVNGSGPLWIGGAAGVNEFFNGLIDDVRLYKRGLSETEINELYAAPAPAAHLPLAILKQPDDAGAIAGQTAKFSSTANSLGLTAQWYKGSTPVGTAEPANVLGGGANASLTTEALTAADNGASFYVVYKGTSGSITSRVAHVTVKTPVNGLLSRYTFDDPANLGADSGTGLNPGAAIGGATFASTSRIGGGALKVDGVSGHIVVPQASCLQFAGTDSYTVSTWFQAEPNGGWGGIVTKSRSNGAWYGIWRDPDGPRMFSGSAELWPPTEPVLPDGGWHHAAIVQDAAAATYKLYVDGVDQNVIAQGTLPDTGIGNLWIGAADNGEYFKGLIDDVRIYNRPLSPEEIAALAAEAMPEAKVSLQIIRTGNKIQITWPASAAGYTLVKTSQLNGGTWSIVDPLPTLHGDQNMVELTAGTQNLFYRLKK